MNTPFLDIKTCALNLLTRREHSQLELRHKLKIRHYDSASIEKVLKELSESELQSDQRFAQMYTHARAERGYGPIRIEKELRVRGVTEDIIHEVLAEYEDSWSTYLEKLIRKKFRQGLARDYYQRAKQLRFLQYRGFSISKIND